MANKQSVKSTYQKLALLAVIGIAVITGGWLLYSNQSDSNNSSQPSATQQAVPQINGEKDLNKIETRLEQTDIDQELDTSDIDSVLSES